MFLLMYYLSFELLQDDGHIIDTQCESQSGKTGMNEGYLICTILTRYRFHNITPNPHPGGGRGIEKRRSVSPPAGITPANVASAGSAGCKNPNQSRTGTLRPCQKLGKILHFQYV